MIKRAPALLHDAGKGRFKLAAGAGIKDLDLHSNGCCRCLAAAVTHDRPDTSVTAGRAGTCHEVRVGAMAETILGRPV